MSVIQSRKQTKMLTVFGEKALCPAEVNSRSL